RRESRPADRAGPMSGRPVPVGAVHRRRTTQPGLPSRSARTSAANPPVLGPQTAARAGSRRNERRGPAREALRKFASRESGQRRGANGGLSIQSLAKKPADANNIVGRKPRAKNEYEK